jgi:hypothetical protein
MEKEFVPYEQALELAKLNFNEKCFGYYGIGNELHIEISWNLDSNLVRRNFIASPTFSQAFRWFRERYNLEYQILKSANGNYSVIIHKNTQEYLDSIAGLINACLDEIVDCYSYEEAEIECLKKLIEIVKQK